jgi:hypothetical protein
MQWVDVDRSAVDRLHLAHVHRVDRLAGPPDRVEISDWSIPKPYPACATSECNTVRIAWECGETTVVLPVVDASKNAAGCSPAGSAYLRAVAVAVLEAGPSPAALNARTKYV